MSRIVRNILLFILLIISVFLYLTMEERNFPEINQPETDLESAHIISRNIDTDKQSLFKLSTHFPNEIPPVIPKEVVEIAEVITDNTPQLTNDIKYISTIIKSDIKHYYFKNIRTGRLITLTEDDSSGQWLIVSIEKEFFILQSGEKKYKVLKK